MSVIQNTLERSTFISDRFKALRMEANSIFAKDKTQISKKKPKSNLLELFSNVPRPFFKILIKRSCFELAYFYKEPPQMNYIRFNIIESYGYNK